MTEIKITNSSSASHTIRFLNDDCYCYQGTLNVQNSIQNVAYGAVIGQDGIFAIGGGYSDTGVPSLKAAMENELLGSTNPRPIGDTQYVYAIFGNAGLWIAQRATSANRLSIYTIHAPSIMGDSLLRPADISYNWAKDERLVQSGREFDDVVAVLIAKQGIIAHPRIKGLSNESIIKTLQVGDYGYAILWNPEFDINAASTNRTVHQSTDIPTPEPVPSERRAGPVATPGGKAYKGTVTGQATRYPRRRYNNNPGILRPRNMAGVAVLATLILLWNSGFLDLLDFSGAKAIFERNNIGLNLQQGGSGDGQDTPSSQCKIITDGGVGAAVRTQPNLDKQNIVPQAGIPNGRVINFTDTGDDDTIAVKGDQANGNVTKSATYYINRGTCK